MPGLRVLTDRDNSAEKSRAVTFYTASYSVGVSLSFLFTGLLAGIFGWRIGFALLALGPLVALPIALVLRRRPSRRRRGRGRPLFDFRPVFANRRALGYILAYSAHGYELTAMRAWMVAFLGFAATARGIGEDHGATAVAAVFSVIGLPASVLGNELSVRFGRRGVLIAIMTVSAVLGAVIGFSPGLPYGIVVALVLFYAVTCTADSGPLTRASSRSRRRRRKGRPSPSIPPSDLPPASSARSSSASRSIRPAARRRPGPGSPASS